MNILEVKNLRVSFGDRPILNNLSFSLDAGDTLAVIGPNGAGKTTLFRAILGAIPYGGEILKSPDTKIGYVPQKVDLERDLPLTIGEFLTLRKSKNAKILYSPEETMELVKLPRVFLKKRLSELSSGELQRVLIAWAIITRPNLLLFDEPTASVDVAGQETIYDLLHRLQDAYRLTLVIISHDLSVVYSYANKVLCVNGDQVCFGAPQDVLTKEELQKIYGGGSKFYHHLHLP